MSDLDARLLEAHARDDRAALVALYSEAANTDEARGFYLTHAFVFALESGAPEAPALRARLQEMGRI